MLEAWARTPDLLRFPLKVDKMDWIATLGLKKLLSSVGKYFSFENQTSLSHLEQDQENRVCHRFRQRMIFDHFQSLYSLRQLWQ